MGWLIDYGTEDHSAVQEPGFRRWVLTICVLMIFCLMVSLFWPEGRELLQLLLIPGDPDVTLEAAEVFAMKLKQGSPAGEAARQFCRTVLQYEAGS